MFSAKWRESLCFGANEMWLFGMEPRAQTHWPVRRMELLRNSNLVERVSSLVLTYFVIEFPVCSFIEPNVLGIASENLGNNKKIQNV